MKTGNNIRQRKDGRYEARYKKGRDENGKLIYGYCYADTYEEAKEKKREAVVSRMPIRQLNLLILGNGNHGGDIYDMASKLHLFHKIDFLDDFNEKGNALGPIHAMADFLDEYPVAIPAIGDDAVRKRWMLELIELGFILPTLIHPSANISSDVEIGAGTVINAGASVGYGAKIGKGCILDTGSTVERNAVVADWTWVPCGKIIRKSKEEELP